MSHTRLNFFSNLIIELTMGVRRLFLGVLTAEAKVVNDDGYSLDPSLITIDECESLREKIDELMVSKKLMFQESLNTGDCRFFGVENYISSLVDLFEANYRKVFAQLYICPEKELVYTIMAGKIIYKEGNTGSGDGWHQDSAFNRQYKLIIYLTDVDDKNGPFQYISGTSSLFEVVKESFKRDRKIGDTRYKGEQLEHLLSRVVEFRSKRGAAILVNTRGIHRGKPLSEGYRYAITYYVYKKRIPKHIANLVNGLEP